MSADDPTDDGLPPGPASVTVPQPTARRWIDLSEEEQLTVARALRPQQGGPLRLAAIVGSPIAASVAASVFGSPIGLGLPVFWVTWVGILAATLGPFALAAVRRRYDLQASGLSREQLRHARKDAKDLVARDERRRALERYRDRRRP